MQILKFYRIDEWDGGDRHVRTPYHFRDKEVAQEAAGQHDHISEAEIIVCDSAEDMKQARSAANVMSVIGKLSSKERVLLGLPADAGEALQDVLNRNAANGKSE